MVFEQCIHLSVEQLMPVMQWGVAENHVGADFKLSAKQVLESETVGKDNLLQGIGSLLNVVWLTIFWLW